MNDPNRPRQSPGRKGNKSNADPGLIQREAQSLQSLGLKPLDIARCFNIPLAQAEQLVRKP